MSTNNSIPDHTASPGPYRTVSETATKRRGTYQVVVDGKNMVVARCGLESDANLFAMSADMYQLLAKSFHLLQKCAEVPMTSTRRCAVGILTDAIAAVLAKARGEEIK